MNNCVYQIPKQFPDTNHENLVIVTPGIGSSKEFNCIITNTIPDVQLMSNGQCFPLYWYEENKGAQGNLFENEQSKYIRHDAITDFILKRAREQYGDKVTKEDIFSP